MDKKEIQICLTNEEYMAISGCIDISLEFFKCMPIKNKNVKDKIEELEKIRNKIFDF